MNRQEIIENATIELANQKLECAVRQVTEYYKMHQCKIQESFLQKTVHGLQQCIETGKKLGFITISILESSLITKTYDLQIAFYNEDLYADDSSIYEYWAPTFIYEYVDSDIEEMEKLLEHQIIRLKPYEVYELKRRYTTNFYFLIGFMVKGLTPKIANLQKFQEVDKENQVKVLFGKYMEKQVEICNLGA